MWPGVGVFLSVYWQAKPLDDFQQKSTMASTVSTEDSCLWCGVGEGEAPT